MGGRGASSGNIIKAVEIHTGDTIISYRQQKNGYLSSLQEDDFVKSNRNIKQIIDIAKEQGYEIKTYNSKQLKEYDKSRKSKRQESDKILDMMSTKDRTKTYNRKGGH